MDAPVVLINSNRMTPPIAPLGLEYTAEAALRSGCRVEIVDLALAEDPAAELERAFRHQQPRLVGVSFRNADDCFWPSGQSFVPQLESLLEQVRGLTDAPIVLGGVGFSIFAEAIMRQTGVEFGIRGDGEAALPLLARAVGSGRGLEQVPGLIWREPGGLRSNRPAWPKVFDVPTDRKAIDNPAYFRRGGQIGLETKRGCDRACIYCADRLAKGMAARLRPPADIADEVESLLAQGIDVLHLCDAEFNIPGGHAREVCDELLTRKLGGRVRWYAYLAVLPFDDALARRMAAAGCVGINFTGDSASAAMLANYRQPHRAEDLAAAVRLCRRYGIAVMLDLLLGGPGETPETVAETIRFVEAIKPDCAGAALGVRIYPGTPMAELVARRQPLARHDGIRRHYSGPLDLLRPTFYISPALGDNPAALVRDLVGGNPVFFPPEEESAPGARPEGERDDHNYSDNAALVEAIAAGARGAYWHILHRLRSA